MATKKRAAKKKRQRQPLFGDPIIINGGGGITKWRRGQVITVLGVTTRFNHDRFGPDSDCDKWVKENSTPTYLYISEGVAQNLTPIPGSPFPLNLGDTV